MKILFLAGARHGHLLPHKDRSCENPDSPKPGAVMIFITAFMRRKREMNKISQKLQYSSLEEKINKEYFDYHQAKHQTVKLSSA